MINNGIQVFWITINSANLQYLLIIHLAGVEFYLDTKTKSTFAQTTATINPVTIAKFDYIICKALFISLLTVGKVEKRLLRPISNYFATVEMNRCAILYLHYLV